MYIGMFLVNKVKEKGKGEIRYREGYNVKFFSFYS